MKYLVAISMAFCLSNLASADLIPLNTENTGQSVTSGLDNNWKYSNFYNVYGFGATTDGTPGSQASLISTPRSTLWIANSTSPSASWIGPAANQSDSTNPGGDAPGVYVYQLTFNSSIARTVQVSGLIAADNDYEIAYGATVTSATIAVQAPGGSSTINTTNYGFNLSTGTQQYGSTSAFSFDISVLAGATTLDFLVLNQNNDANNPTGLFVTDFQVTAVPEPPTAAIVLMGLGLAWGRHHWRRRTYKLAGLATALRSPRIS